MQTTSTANYPLIKDPSGYYITKPSYITPVYIDEDYYKLTERKSKELIKKAVWRVYDLGYITYDEANQLISNQFVQRNEFTSITLQLQSITKVVIHCLEYDADSTNSQTTLFRFSYDIIKDQLVDEGY